MQNYNLKAMKQQAGMTLIELTVVLLVLVGLAGLTIPYISGFVGKTHNSTSADSGASLFNSLQLYAVQQNGLPNNLNLLTTDSAGTVLAPYLDNNWAALNGNLPTNFKSVSVAAFTGSLKAAGLTTFTYLTGGASITNPDGSFTSNAINGATFSPENTGASLAAVTNLVTDNSAHPGFYTAGASSNTSIANALNYTAATGNHQLFVLGVGPTNAAVGKTLSSVPVHFGDKGSLQPTYTYSRFLVAIDVDTNGVQPAKAVGIVHAPDIQDAWESLSSSIAAYYAS